MGHGLDSRPINRADFQAFMLFLSPTDDGDMTLKQTYPVPSTSRFIVCDIFFWGGEGGTRTRGLQ